MNAIALAEKLDNVSEATRISGCSRETIYKDRRLLKEKGPLALKRTFQADKHHKNRTSQCVEKTVIAFSLLNPHLRQMQAAAHLKKNHDIAISPNGVRHIWLREKMNTSVLRNLKAISSSHVALPIVD